MKEYEVCIEGNFVKEFYIKAESESDARKIAEDKLNVLIGLDKEEYVVDSITTITNE